MLRILHTALLLALLTASCTGSRPAGAPETVNGLPLLFTDDFEDGSAAWQPMDPENWQVVTDEGDRALAFLGESDYEPPVRSPHNVALIEDLWVSDFVLEARLKSTQEEYGHRDMVLFYNWQDPANFYYTHIASAADPHAHSIFLVDDAPRVSIAQERTDGVSWDDEYHRVRVIRDTERGTIEVFFDDMTTPIMRTEDRTFTWGRIGFGSFDDSGLIDDVRVWGKRVTPSTPVR